MSDERIRQNGVTMPQAGGKTRAPWDIATKLSEGFGRPATREEVLKACEEAGIAKGTRETQYSHWKKFHGLTGRVVKPKSDKPKTPPAPANTAPPSQNATPPPAPSNNPRTDPPGVPGTVVYDAKNNTDIYDAGWDAYCEGKNKSDNPHPPSCQERDTWDQGFEDAKKA